VCPPPGSNTTANRTHHGGGGSGGGVCRPFSPYDADAGATHWRPDHPGFSGIASRLYIDTPGAFDRATSPVVVAQGRGAGAGLLEYTFGLVHASGGGGNGRSARLLAYPELTALQYVFLHPHTTVLAQLLNATCFCPPGDDTTGETVPCWTAWLCAVLDQAVMTLLAPVDPGWGALSSDAVNFLFTNPAAGFLTVAYHVLGPAAASRFRPYLDVFDQTCVPRTGVALRLWVDTALPRLQAHSRTPPHPA
jgi:hypothetical protein